MSKYSQGIFPRLAIVASQRKQSRETPAARWWSPARTQLYPNDAQQPAMEASVCPRRLVVMPRLSQGWLRRLLRKSGNFVRSYFVGQPAHPRRAAVLSFRRFGEPMGPGKKPSGSVRWNSQEVANQEGGRG